MAIDFDLVTKIALPIVGGLITKILNDLIERRPRLVCFYGHSSGVNAMWDANVGEFQQAVNEYFLTHTQLEYEINSLGSVGFTDPITRIVSLDPFATDYDNSTQNNSQHFIIDEDGVPHATTFFDVVLHETIHALTGEGDGITGAEADADILPSRLRTITDPDDLKGPTILLENKPA